MNIKIVFFLLLLFLTLIEHSESWGIRLPVVRFRPVGIGPVNVPVPWLSFRRRRRRRSPPPPPDHPPRFTDCSNVAEWTTEADGKKRVDYKVPTAKDDRGGLQVRRTAGLPPGSHFPEGVSHVTYEASDSASQKAYCHLTVTVRVRRCPAISPTTHRTHSCSKSNIVGSLCNFYCAQGYRINDSDLSSSVCSYMPVNSHLWSSDHPTCQVKTCSPALTSLPNGRVSCTKSNQYGSRCTFSCNEGYGFADGVNPVRTCTDSWSGSTPTCIDTQPPTFQSCPADITVVAEDALNTAVVTWDVPVAQDNEPDALVSYRAEGQAPGTRFNQGSHRIVYLARDRQGNVGQCIFTVTVRVITCNGFNTQSPGLVFSCPNGFVKGAQCTFECDTGYQLEGEPTSTCQSTGAWSTAQPTCQILRCPALSPPAHGSFKDSQPCDNIYNSWCYFECDTGYTISGSSARRCETSPSNQTVAYWSGTTIECIIQTCLAPTPGQGLEPTPVNTCPAGSAVTYGNMCSYGCSVGYSLHGESTLTCSADGQWLQTLPQCTEITCASSDLPEPTNGVKSGCPRDQEPYGTTCTLSCNRGYTPTTTFQRTCQDDGNDNGVWSNGTISCTIVTCPVLSAPANGFISGCDRLGQVVTLDSPPPFDTICSFGCSEGYTLYGTVSRTCLVSGTWDGSNLECRDVTAPIVQCPPDQVIFATKGQITVSVSWDWEPILGTDAGGDIPAILKTINSDPVTGSKPTSLAEGTHSLVYMATDSAGNSESCSMQIEAKVTRCLALSVPLNGAMRLASGHGSCTEGAVYGSICEITCDVGYTLSTEGATLPRQCRRDNDVSTLGFWTLSQPTCEANECVLPTVTNGYITNCPGDTATYGDTCQFHCDLGHRSSSGESSRARQCQADRTWSGPDFQCTVTVQCPGPFSIPHGRVQPDVCHQADALPYGTICTFSCDAGYSQEGPSIKTCTDHGSWDNPQNTLCRDEERPVFVGDCPRYLTFKSEFNSTSKRVDFEAPSATDNSGEVSVSIQSGHLAPNSSFPEGKTVITYIATDSSLNSAQCDVIITIQVHRCERLSAPASGSIQCDHTSPIAGTVCTLGCNTGYTLSGSQSRTCQLTNDDAPYWDGSTTLCTIITCPSQDAPANSIKSGCDQPSQSYGTECSFSCVYGYEADTSDGGRSRCRADGTWSGTDLVCNKTECLAIVTPVGIAVTPAVCSNNPDFGQDCLLTCTQSGFVLKPPGSEYIKCLGNGQWSQDISTIQCADEERPHFTSCPSILVSYADRGSMSAQVSFSVTAADNDPDHMPTVTCDPESGQFDLGVHQVSCIASDASGNTATCSIQVEVNERRCPYLSPPTHGHFLGSCSDVYGSICQVVCIQGYHLVGSNQTTCEYDGNSTYWHWQDPPSCVLTTCDTLSIPDTVHVTPSTCTTGSPVAGTQCIFFCVNSFSLVGGVNSVTCGNQGSWDDGINNLPTNCEDQAAPVLTYCPGPIYATLEESDGVSVSFDQPRASDNDESGTLTITTLPANISSPHLFIESTVVYFTFTDSANNSVTCTFPVEISDQRQPLVIFCPKGYNITTTEAITTVIWDEPIFEDPSGDELEVSNNRGESNQAELAWGSHSVVYTATDPSNSKTAVCQFLVNVEPESCPSLHVPRYGALACDLWAYGTLCSMFCNANYDIPRPRPGATPPTQYVCGSSGTWRPHSNVPDCSVTRNARRANLPSELMYFTGDCPSTETQESIAAAFIELLKTSMETSEGCNSDADCAVENVRITCGATPRRRRSVDMIEEVYRDRLRRSPKRANSEEVKRNLMQSRLKVGEEKSRRRRQRDTMDETLVVNFEISVPVTMEPGSTPYDATRDAETMMIGVAQGFVDGVGMGSIPALEVPGVNLTVNTDSFSYDYAEITCLPGYIADNIKYICIACGTGSMFDNSTIECHSCPIGYYQDQVAQFACIQCPSGTSTASNGTMNGTLCRDQCLPGNYSDSGVVPCLQCPVGYYQPERGQSSCQACPDGTTTLGYGAQSVDQCVEICSPGTVSDTGIVPCTPCKRHTYQPQSQQKYCIPCLGSNTTLTEGSTSVKDCIDVDECASSPCDHDATCVDLIDGYRCDCPPGYQGVHCQENIDDCPGHRCTNGATCVDEVMGYQCQCLSGFQGEFCETNIDECDSSPCQHEGDCQDGVNGYLCQCTPAYHGIHCEQEINSCSPSPCHNGATCQLLDGGYQCQCAPGYRGINCTLDINECNSSPCLNGATCQDMPNAYLCECASGYEGIHCDIDIDWCASSPCYNGSTCVDSITTFLCVCTLDRAGTQCEIRKTPCYDAPCKNGATCLETDDPPASYTCQCPAGYIGLNCEIDFDECASGPCSNGGTCQDQLNSFMCDCPSGFHGDMCEMEIDECASSPCAVGNGNCNDEVDGYTCHCEPGWTGSHCEAHIDYCDPPMCQHGAICNNMATGYQCQCVTGFTGMNCESDIDECQSGPCLHGNCSDYINGYYCSCSQGFTGAQCDANIDDCYEGACKNNGTCIDGIASYSCICADGFTGTLCQEPVDYCLSSPCQHQGTCLNKSPGYECMCLSGYVGGNCEEDFDECSLHECIHASSCTDGINSYTCTCNEGYTGTNCELDIDECSSSPCSNGSTCLNYISQFICICPAGFTGTLCEIDVDECMSNPCHHNSQCIDDINGFTCVCQSGTTGEQCGINIDDCAFNPCENGGECLDQLNAYVCQCLPGYEGTNCQLDINECQEMNVVCENGGTCNDKVADFECECIAGYRGRYCQDKINECESNPCRNGAQCNDEDAAFSCNCTLGFTGPRCEVELDLCKDVPCSNGATCSPLPGGFTCSCPPGYSGSLCEHELDECSSMPCQPHQVSCLDHVNGYVCVCLPGYTGDHCETELQGNFDLHFTSVLPASELIHTGNLTDSILPNVSLSLWLRSPSCHGNYTVLRFLPEGGPSLILSDASSPTLGYFNLDASVIFLSSALCDGRWHNMLLTWQTLSDSQEWMMYVDQLKTDEGTRQGPQILFQRGLAMIIGPVATDQDDIGGGEHPPLTLDLTGINIWSKAWRHDQIPSIASSCIPSSPADVFAWSEMMTKSSATISQTLSAPSQCDDSDECDSNPCQSGTCEDQLGAFVCHCPDGYEGDRCQTIIDYCHVDSCLNNATCLTESLGSACMCPAGYNGSICELQVVDGSWGQWSAFSDCSMTCGGGFHNRSRSCDTPRPINDGQPCQGDDNEVQECNTAPCPACLKLRYRIRNGRLDCEEPVDEEQACRIYCNSGYDFEEEPKDVYRCGPNTSYAWNHQSAQNPYGRLPRCLKSNPSVGKSGRVSFGLPSGTTCDSASAEEDIKQSASQSTAATGMPCLKDGTCSVKVAVDNCNTAARRVSRQTSSAVQITLTFVFNNTEPADNQTSGDTTDPQQNLESLMALIQTGQFTVTVQGEVIQPDPESVLGDTWTLCPEGMVESVGDNCVQCGLGSFMGKDDPAIDEYTCVPCPANTYQDEEGQTFCTMCPHGMVTNGVGAIDISECYDKCGVGMYRIRSEIIGDNQCEPCPLNSYNDDGDLDYCVPCPEGLITSGTGSISETDCVEPPTTPANVSAGPESTTTASTFRPTDPSSLLVPALIISAAVVILIVAVITIVCCVKLKTKSMNKVEPGTLPYDPITRMEAFGEPTAEDSIPLKYRMPSTSSPPPYEA